MGIGVLVSLGMGHYYAVLDKDFVNEECNILCRYRGDGTLEAIVPIVEVRNRTTPMHLGPYPITLIVQDTIGNPIVGAIVRIPGAGSLLSQPPNGQVVFYLQQGTYTVYINSSVSYIPNNPYTVTVDSNGLASPSILVVQSFSLPQPTDPDCFILWSGVRDEHDLPYVATEITVKVVEIETSGRVDPNNDLIRAVCGTEVTTDNNGQWSMEIPRGLNLYDIVLCFNYKNADGNTVVEYWRGKLNIPEDDMQLSWADTMPEKIK